MKTLAKPIIGVDLMGGDHPPISLLSGILDNFKKTPQECKFFFYCDETSSIEIKATLARFSLDHPLDYAIKTTSQTITLSDQPLQAVKSKKDSTLWVGIQNLRDKQIDAFVAVGNTGALLAIAHFTMDLLPGISRPALMARLPTLKNSATLLDVGANAQATADQLHQFTLIGSAYLRSMGKAYFQVGLLNIGSEEHKGKIEHKEAYAKIKELHTKSPEIIPSFIGNIEPQDVFLGHCDLIITDGFSGNIFLKSAEGTSQLILKTLQKLAPSTISQDQVEKLMLGMRPYFEHEVNPGALLTGINGIIIKCHSYFDGRALFHAICHARDLIRANFIEKIKSHLSD